MEDVSLEFEAMGRLPGPFIRFFMEEMVDKTICSMLDGLSRRATARCVVGFCDGDEIKLFEGSLPGHIAQTPAGNRDFGWDQIFVPEGYEITRAELGEEDDRKTYLQLKPLEALKNFLINR